MSELEDITPEGSVAPVYLDPTPIEPIEVAPADDVAELRRAAYAQRSDPLFFKWQRGEATQDEWLAEVEAVKSDYPIA